MHKILGLSFLIVVLAVPTMVFATSEKTQVEKDFSDSLIEHLVRNHNSPKKLRHIAWENFWLNYHGGDTNYLSCCINSLHASQNASAKASFDPNPVSTCAYPAAHRAKFKPYFAAFIARCGKVAAEKGIELNLSNQSHSEDPAVSPLEIDLH